MCSCIHFPLSRRSILLHRYLTGVYRSWASHSMSPPLASLAKGTAYTPGTTTYTASATYTPGTATPGTATTYAAAAAAYSPGTYGGYSAPSYTTPYSASTLAGGTTYTSTSTPYAAAYTPSTYATGLQACGNTYGGYYGSAPVTGSSYAAAPAMDAATAAPTYGAELRAACRSNTGVDSRLILLGSSCRDDTRRGRGAWLVQRTFACLSDESQTLIRVAESLRFFRTLQRISRTRVIVKLILPKC